ncbi:MAG: hypothetical protein V7752_03700 [Halopseudomonas sp.]
MKNKNVIGIVLIAACAAGLSATVQAKSYLVSLNSVTGGNCDSFGGGWQGSGYDGKSGIVFCKKISGSKPALGVVEVNGIYPGDIDCKSKFGKEWEEFGYDGKADLRYCMKMGDVDASENYIEDTNAVVGGSGGCKKFKGRGWDSVVYNGNSDLTLCAKFR